MTQNTDPSVNESIKMSPSGEELELFRSYREQLDEAFKLFKQDNLAITIQQNELQKLKVKLEEAYEEFNRQRDASKKVLDDIRRDIEIEKSLLGDLRRESNNYRRKIRHLEKKINDLEKCQPAEENSKKSENF